MAAGGAAPELLIIGHIVADWRAGRRVLGGTPAYAAHVARAFGAPISILTSAAPAEPLLRELDFADVRVVPADQTTTMENHYGENERWQVMRSVAAPLGVADVPAEWRAAKYVMLACMAGEIEPALAGAFPQARILLTAQGYFRQWDENGRVRPRPWWDEQMLRALDVVVFSEEDVRGLPQWQHLLASARAVVLTRGREGGTLYQDGRAQPYATLRAGEVELTGAGDVFASCLLCGMRAGLSVAGATKLAGRLAGISVSREGMDSAPTAAEIAEQRDFLRRAGGDGGR